MKQKLKLGQLVDSKSALERLILNELPLVLAFELKVFVQSVNPHLSSFREIEVDRVKKYGSPSLEDGAKYDIRPEGVLLYKKEMDGLREKEVDVDVPEIGMDALMKLNGGEGISISPADLMNLEYLIKR